MTLPVTSEEVGDTAVDARDGIAPAPAGPPAPSTHAPYRRWVRSSVALDTLAAAAAATTAILIRFGLDSTTSASVSYPAVGLAVVLGWPVLVGIAGAYELKASLFGVEELRRILRAGLFLLATAGVAHIAFRLSLSRGYFLALLPLTVAFTAVGRGIVKAVLSRGADSVHHHRIVAVGPVCDVVRLRADLCRTGTRAQVQVVVAYVADDLDPDAPAPSELADRTLRTIVRPAGAY